MTITQSYGAAQDTCRDYVCSACWGELEYRQYDKSDPRTVTMYCHECKENTPGFVTRKYAMRKAERNGQEFQEARRALRDALPWLHIPVEKTEAEILKALGY